MALPGQTQWEIRSDGDDTNGGGWYTSGTGTDFSQQASKRTGGDITNISATDAVGNGSSAVTSATANFTTAIIGNIIYLQGGTGSLAAGWYYVSARPSSTQITVDRNVASGTGITMNIGGAMATPGAASAIVPNAATIYIKNLGSIYSITSATANVANGCMNPGTNVWVGYSTNRTIGNTDTPPTIQLNVSTGTIVGAAGVTTLENFILDGNNQTTSKAVSNSNALLRRCLLKKFTSTSNGSAYRCVATENSASVFAGTTAVFCMAYANTATPFSTRCLFCISFNNTGATTDGYANGVSFTAYGCIAYGNGRDGFRVNNGNDFILNCVAVNNVGIGLNILGTTFVGSYCESCAHYNNGTNVGGNSGPNTFSNNLVALTADPFVNAAGGNFALNNTVGGGMLLKASGFGTLPEGNTIGYPDIGAAARRPIERISFSG